MPEASAAEPWHGTPGGYTNHKCREKCCRKAHAEAQAVTKEKRFAKGRANPELIPHGTEGGYGNWGCRKSCCRAAHNAAKAEQKKRREAREASNASTA